LPKEKSVRKKSSFVDGGFRDKIDRSSSSTKLREEEMELILDKLDIQ
jgi:hypothetical protein